MAKYFEITYSPSQWSAPPGGIASEWSAPYGGLNVQTPENAIGPQYSPSINNFILRNSELRSRPVFTRLLPGPDGQNPILGVGSFLSKGSVWHTFAFTSNGMFQLQPSALKVVAAGGNPWVRLGGPALDPNTFVAWRAFQGVLYYTNGAGHLSAWDGAAASPITDVAFTGSTVPPPSNQITFSSKFLGELDNHIMLAYTTEVTNSVATTYPQRLRWSNNGFNPFDASGNFGANLGTQGATFDPSIFVNAGVTDFLDVPDVLTGTMYLGNMGYLFRQNGITRITPTGQGTSPFLVEHLWASERGIGNVYPDTISQYGSIGSFVSTDNVYQANPQGIQGIGGGARDAIMADLSNTISSPRAIISPAYSVGYIYLAYHLFIPMVGGTRIYVYSYEDNNWTSWFISNQIIGLPAPCWSGDIPIVSASQTAVGATGGTTPPATQPSPSSSGGIGVIGGGGFTGSGPRIYSVE